MMANFLCWLCVAGAVAAQTPGRIVVIAHRGEHLSNPENTIPAFRAAIDAGADYFELDVRTTADGYPILMHDARVDRTTDGHGEVSRMSFKEIRTLHAGRALVPSFAEALAAAKGHCGVYVDIKSARPEDVVSALETAEMQDSAVLYGGVANLTAIHRLRPEWRVMPEAVGADVLERIFETLHPQVVAFNARDFTGDLIARAKKHGASIYVDRLGNNDNPAAWDDAIGRGADGIQTDHPAELVRFLGDRGRR